MSTESSRSAAKPCRIIVGASGASGMPILKKCLELIRADGHFETILIMTENAKLTFSLEMDEPLSLVESLADRVLPDTDIAAGPASGTFRTEGMLIVPCSMKTAAGICSGYTDGLLLRAADVTLKEQRPLVLAARETPVSAIHLRNLHSLSMIPGVRIIPPMMEFYSRPETIDDMVTHIASKLVEPFGIASPNYRRWKNDAE